MVNEFRPISLINVIFKIISKVLANRLRPHIHCLVDQVQSAFNKNRYILHSVACAQKIIAASHNSNMKAIFLKLDFEKSFDSVSWEFIFQLLVARGFGQRWIGWIKACLLFGTSSILINERSCNYIQCIRGLRQGDPISPTYSSLLSTYSLGSFPLLAGMVAFKKLGSYVCRMIMLAYIMPMTLFFLCRVISYFFTHLRKWRSLKSIFINHVCIT